MWMIFLILLILSLPLSVQAKYLGELSENLYVLDSTANPFGGGSPFKPDGINNPDGAGSPYRSDSPTNPYGRGLRIEGK